MASSASNPCQCPFYRRPPALPSPCRQIKSHQIRCAFWDARKPMPISKMLIGDAHWRANDLDHRGASSLTQQRPHRVLHRLQSGRGDQDRCHRRSWLRAIWLSHSDQPIRLATVAVCVRTACCTPSTLSQGRAASLSLWTRGLQIRKGGRSGDGAARHLVLRVVHGRCSEPLPCLAVDPQQRAAP